MKKLFKVVFSGPEGDRVCPLCTKSLHNGMKLTVLKPCGHVCCAPCLKKFKVREQRACAVCDLALRPARDIVELVSEGTGFVGAGGQNVAETYTHAFQ